MLEKRDLYDNQRKLTGEQIYIGEKIPKDRYITTVTLFLQNDKQKLLIEKRSKEKGGKYGFISGHPKAGETSVEGMITEVKEELGLQIKKEDITCFFTTKQENSFFDLYYLKQNVNILSLNVQKKEVEYARWCSIEQIKELIDNQKFCEKHIEAYNEIKKYLGGC